MSARKETVHAYFDGFRRGDHAKILALLGDDVVWDIYGRRNLQGKGAFDSEIENEAFEGNPKLTFDRITEEGESIVVPHLGEAKLRDGGLLNFAAVDVFTFDGELIARVESYVVPL